MLILLSRGSISNMACACVGFQILVEYTRLLILARTRLDYGGYGSSGNYGGYGGYGGNGGNNSGYGGIGYRSEESAPV